MDLIGFVVDMAQAAVAVLCALFFIRFHRRSRGNFCTKGYVYFFVGFLLFALKKVIAGYAHLAGYSMWTTFDDIVDSLGLPILGLFFLGFRERFLHMERYLRDAQHLKKLRDLTDEMFGANEEDEK